MIEKLTEASLLIAAFGVLVAAALLIYGASAMAAALPPKPRIVIDCGTLRGSGSVAVEIPGTRYVTPFNCPQSDP